jgi:thiamine pyrophosphokinase
VNLTQVMLAEGAGLARTAIIFTAGGPARATLPEIESDALVIAADGGVAEAERLGYRVDLLVGDLDSADPAVIARVEAARGTIQRHPTDKDASDLELAMAAGVAAEVRRIVVVGGDAGRLDHLLGNAFLLGSALWAGVEIDAVLGVAIVHVIRDDRTFDGRPGELVSLYAVGGPAEGVTTDGLRWPLDGDELLPGSTLGLSNEFVATTARVRLEHGVVLAIRPGLADA